MHKSEHLTLTPEKNIIETETEKRSKKITKTCDENFVGALSEEII